MLLKALRNGLGYTIVFIDQITRPKPLQRSAEEQQLVDDATKHFSIYQFHACPFCVKTRRAIHKLNLPMTYRDVKPEGQYREELLQQGGEVKVPCLRIEEDEKVTWMYESTNIIQYLQNRFTPKTS